MRTSATPISSGRLGASPPPARSGHQLACDVCARESGCREGHARARDRAKHALDRDKLAGAGDDGERSKADLPVHRPHSRQRERTNDGVADDVI